ncbi:MAG TPA: hypothetical protein VFT74_17270 [Isosphaeraceae bacterium]|nr:hypothetical protein [Isosphaeraceae bacterium]
MFLALFHFGLSHRTSGGDDVERGQDNGARKNQPANEALPTGRILDGTINRIFSHANSRFTVQCYPRRDTEVDWLLRVDRWSLILRRGDDGQLTRIAYEELFKRDESFQALVSRIVDPDGERWLVYWIIVFPRNAERPFPGQ